MRECLRGSLRACSPLCEGPCEAHDAGRERGLHRRLGTQRARRSAPGADTRGGGGVDGDGVGGWVDGVWGRARTRRERQAWRAARAGRRRRASRSAQDASEKQAVCRGGRRSSSSGLRGRMSVREEEGEEEARGWRGEEEARGWRSGEVVVAVDNRGRWRGGGECLGRHSRSRAHNVRFFHAACLRLLTASSSYTCNKIRN